MKSVVAVALRTAYFVLAMLIAAPLPSSGQDADEEIVALRRHLGVSESISVEVASARALPSTSPTKVYLALGLDITVRDRFAKWADEWNRKDAQKYGAVVLVPQLGDADVILARYLLRDRVTSQTTSRVVQAYAYDPRSGSTVPHPVAQTYSTELVPVFAYVLTRGSGNIDIVDRYSDHATLGDHKNAGRALWDSFKTLLKERPRQGT